MGIYIKGMEMPETCDDCPFPYVSASYDKYMECPLSKCEPTALKRNDDCPLVEVPTPHGRLVDADALVEDLIFPSKHFEEGFKSLMNDSPIIIEAEGKDGRT